MLMRDVFVVDNFTITWTLKMDWTGNESFYFDYWRVILLFIYSMGILT